MANQAKVPDVLGNPSAVPVFVYDEDWRIVAVFHEDDPVDEPKEEFVHHNAGMYGFGGSSLLDAVILRNRDESSAWSSTSDGVLETRHYYCQNWRGDVSVVLSNSGRVEEWVKYSSYGVPFVALHAQWQRSGVLVARSVAEADGVSWRRWL